MPKQTVNRGGGRLKERDVTRQIRDYLKLKHIWHFKAWQGPMSLPGISDILGIYDGKFMAIEVKAPGAHATTAQEAFLSSVKDQGGIAFVAWDVDDVVRELLKYNMGGK